MSQIQSGNAADRRMHMEAVIAQYPNLQPETLDELLHWFRKEATALDVGLIASNDAISAAYRQFRKEHIDGIKKQDIVPAIGFLLLVAGFIALLWWGAA